MPKHSIMASEKLLCCGEFHFKKEHVTKKAWAWNNLNRFATMGGMPKRSTFTSEKLLCS